MIRKALQGRRVWASVPSVSHYPIIVFADGASSGNPGPGGWGAVIAYPEGQIEELGGRDPETTNNRMEMMAVIRALERLAKRPEPIEVYTDSTYVIRGITQWVWGWEKARMENR